MKTLSYKDISVVRSESTTILSHNALGQEELLNETGDIQVNKAPIPWLLVSHQVVSQHTMRAGGYYHYLINVDHNLCNT